MLRTHAHAHDHSRASRVPAILVALLLYGSLCGSRTAHAQAVSPLALGVRIRVSPRDSMGAIALLGNVVRRTPDSLVLRIADTERDSAVAFAQVAGIAISRGVRTRTARGAGIGFLAGAFFGAALGVTSSDDDGCCMGGAGPNWPMAGIAAGVFGLVGTLTGSVVGSQHRQERWESIPARLWRIGIDSSHEAPSVSTWRAP